MASMKPWSYSSLTSFETCPHRFNVTRNLKQAKEEQGEAQKWGEWAHKQFENFFTEGTPMPEKVSHRQVLADKLAAKPGEKLVEDQMAVSASFQPADWWQCWARGIIDFAAVDGERAIVVDHKTGKRRVDSDQLKLFAGFTFAHYPEVNTVVTAFLWLKENKLDRETFTRDQEAAIWQEFLPRVLRLELAYEKDKWPPKPSGLCRSWCPLTRKQCEFSGRQ